MSGVKEFILKKINNKTVIFVLIAAVLVVILLGTAFMFFFSKTAKQFYLESEAKNFKKYSDQIKQMYRGFYSAQKPYIEGSYKKRLEVTANLKSEDTELFGVENIQGIFDIINKCKVVVDSKNNVSANTSISNIALLLEKAPLVDATVFKKDKQLGFTLPIVLPNRYFTLNTDKLDEVYDRFYKRYEMLPIKPKRAINIVDLAKTIKFSDVELDSIAKDYGSFVSSLIEDMDVEYGSYLTIKVGDGVIKGRKVSVVLDSLKTKKLIGGLLDKMSNDDDEQGYLKIDKNIKDLLSTLNTKKDVAGFKASLKKFLSRVDYPEGLKMTLYIDSLGNILERKVDISLSSKDNERYAVNIVTGTNSIINNNFKTGICNLKITNMMKDGNVLTREYSVNSNIIPINKNEKGTVVANYTGKKNDALELSTQVDLDVSSSLDELTMKNNSSIKYVISWLKDKTEKSGDKIIGELSRVSWKNNKLKTKNENTSLTINAQMHHAGLNNTSLKLNLNGEDKFDIGEFQLPQLSASNIIDLNTVSDKELEKVEGEIAASFGTFYLKNKPIMDAVMGN